MGAVPQCRECVDTCTQQTTGGEAVKTVDRWWNFTRIRVKGKPFVYDRVLYQSLGMGNGTADLHGNPVRVHLAGDIHR